MPRNRLYISAAPQILFIKWLPQNLPQREKIDVYAELLFQSTVFIILSLKTDQQIYITYTGMIHMQINACGQAS